MAPMADSRETTLESLPVDPALLESANRWFDISWYGLLIAGGFTALAAFATVFFLFVQFWSSGIRERETEWRTARLELQTGKAKAELAKANADIASANAEIAEAKKQTASLEKDAAEARRDIAAANARAAEANQKAEAERLDRLKQELRIAPQDLAGQPRSELVALFRSFGAQSVDVFEYAEGSSPDTAPFAQTMIAVFTEAGWRARYWTTIGGAGVVTGVVVATRQGSDENIEGAANSIVLGLRHWDFAASRWDQHFTTNDAKEIPGTAGVSGPTWDANDVAPIRVFVGTKPP
jgi:hypothetical protein